MKLGLAMLALIGSATSVPAIGQLIQPGRWQIVSTPTSVDMPGAPQIAAMMKGKPTKISLCITPEQAKLGPQALGKAGKNCRYTRFDVRGHHIDSQMICNFGAGTMTATSSGTFNFASFAADGRSVMTGRQRMTTVSHAEGRRVGDCSK